MRSADGPRVPPRSRAHGTRFVGRLPEISALEGWLQAAEGKGVVVLLGGEPGIGKSRLLREFAGRARVNGWLVLAGSAYDTEGVPPYLPFVEVLRQYVQFSSDEDLQPLVAAAPEIATLLPELVSRFGSLPPGHQSPESARYALFQAASDFFIHVANSTEARGLVICLDDLHWADRSTLLLFQHLAREVSGARLCLVGTYRTVGVDSDHPLFRILADLERERLYETVRLAPLSLNETATLVLGLTGRTTVSPPLIEAVHDHTRGNPFFIEELVRHLQSETRDLDDPALASGAWGTPRSVRQVIGSRVARLTPETRSLLGAAAVLSDEFSLMFPALARMLDVEIPMLEHTVEEAVSAGMFREDGEMYRFAHALIRDALLEGMPAPRRQGLHLRAARAMEELYAGNLEPRLSAIAVHYRRAGPFADRAKAIEYSIRAGEAAQAAFAYESVADHWNAALDLMEQADVAARASLIERLGELMQVFGFDNYGKSAAYFEQAITLRQELGDSAGEAATHARLALLLGAGSPINDNPAALRHLQAAAPLLKEGPASDAQLSFYSALGLIAVWQVKTEEGLAAATRAMEIALTLGREDRWVTNAVMRSYHLHALGHLAEGNALMAEAWETANRLNDTYRAFVAAGWLGNRLLELRDPLEARAWYQKEIVQPRQIAAPTRRQALQRLIAATFACAGELERCRSSLADAGTTPGPFVPFWEARWDQFESTWTEEREAAPAALDRSGQAMADCWLARVRRLRGDAAGAIRFLSDALAIGLDGPDRLLQLQASAELAIVLAEIGRPEESEVHLARCREIVAEGEDWRGLAGRVALAEAVYAAASGRGEHASKRFEFAIGVFRRLTLPWDEAEAFELQARSCKRFHRGRTRQTFLTQTLNSARAVYERIGAGQPWLDRLDAYGKGVMGAAADAGAREQPPDRLTPRELEVLRLIATGKSGKEIAAELVLSVRTVERHIANIYLKTNLHGRAQIANYAMTHELGAPAPAP